MPTRTSEMTVAASTLVLEFFMVIFLEERSSASLRS